MRILVVSNLYPPTIRGGYELLCRGTVDGLRAEHDVTVLTSDLEAAAAPHEERIRRDIPWLRPGPAGSLGAPVATLRAVRAARRALATTRPDLVYVWNPGTIPQGAVRAIELSGVPMAFSVCAYEYHQLYADDQYLRHLKPGETGPRGVWARGVRAWNRQPGLRLEVTRPVDAAVAWISEAVRRVGPPPSSNPVFERVLHPGAPRPDAFDRIDRRPAPDPLVAFVGRVEHQKGTDIAVRALGLLRERYGISARLVCCGAATSDMEQEVRNLAGELDVAVELRGQLPEAEVAAVLGAAHALVVPSRWEEPYGLVCLEGALARVPVVAARSGGIPEALHDEEHALLFERGDPDACAAALARVLGDPEETAARVERALARAHELSWPRYVEAQSAFVSDALASLRST